VKKDARKGGGKKRRSTQESVMGGTDFDYLPKYGAREKKWYSDIRTYISNWDDVQGKGQP